MTKTLKYAWNKKWEGIKNFKYHIWPFKTLQVLVFRDSLKNILKILKKNIKEA